MLVSAYYMLDRDEPYRDLGIDWFDQRHDDAHTRRLVAQLKASVTPWSSTPPTRPPDGAARQRGRLLPGYARCCRLPPETTFTGQWRTRSWFRATRRVRRTGLVPGISAGQGR